MALPPSTKKTSVQKSHLRCLFKAKLLSPQQEIIDGTGNFQKGHFCWFHFMYNVSHFIVIEKLIRPPKRVTVLLRVQSRPTHFLLHSTTHAGGGENFPKEKLTAHSRKDRVNRSDVHVAWRSANSGSWINGRCKFQPRSSALTARLCLLPKWIWPSWFTY